MKRVIIDLDDSYADVLTMTSIGMVQHESGSMLNVHGGMALDLHNVHGQVHYEQIRGDDGMVILRKVE